MTFIKPSQERTIWHLIFVVGGLLLASEMVMVIYLYNRTVNLNAAIGKAKDDIQHIGSKNALLERQAVLSFDSAVRAEEPYRALVEDTHPEYLNLQNDTWLAASRF